VSWPEFCGRAGDIEHESRSRENEKSTAVIGESVAHRRCREVGMSADGGAFTSISLSNGWDQVPTNPSRRPTGRAGRLATVDARAPREGERSVGEVDSWLVDGPPLIPA
jgi:hypothetical protein